MVDSDVGGLKWTRSEEDGVVVGVNEPSFPGEGNSSVQFIN